MVFKDKKKKTNVEQQVLEGSNGGGRVQSLPSILSKTQPQEENGRAHKSNTDDTLISLEEYNAIAELLHPGRNQDELDVRTDLNTMQIIQFSRGRIIAKRFGIRYLNDYITYISRFSLSHKRKSRLEHVKAISGLVGDQSGQPKLLERLG